MPPTSGQPGVPAKSPFSPQKVVGATPPRSDHSGSGGSFATRRQNLTAIERLTYPFAAETTLPKSRILARTALSPEPRLKKIAAALAKDPSDRRTLAEWADRVALSESSLARLVVRETGLSFGRWRQQLHLIVALRELTSGASVQQVSADLGYDSVAAFITMFKKALGKPPGKYLSGISPEYKS